MTRCFQKVVAMLRLVRFGQFAAQRWNPLIRHSFPPSAHDVSPLDKLVLERFPLALGGMLLLEKLQLDLLMLMKQ